MIRPLGSQFDGFYYDGHTAVRDPATITLSADRLTVTVDGAAPFSWAYSEMKLASEGVYGSPARVERIGKPEILVVQDTTFRDSLQQHAPLLTRRNWWDFSLEGWPAVLVSCIIIVALGSFLYFWGIRWAADTAARFAPRSVEEKLGLAVVNLLAPPAQRCSNPASEAMLAKVSKRLATAAGPEYHYRIIYARLGIVNAFAAPGGYIVVSEGLLRTAETPEEFAGVLAHEMEHVLHKHSTRAIARELGGRVILGLLATDSSGTPLAAEGLAKLVSLGYQRSDEEQADESSLELLAKAQISAGGLATFLRRLEGDGSSVEQSMRYLSTHPASRERAAKLEARTGTAVTSLPLMSAQEWNVARNVCVTPRP